MWNWKKENQLNSITKEYDYFENSLKSNKNIIKEITDYKSTTEILNIKKNLNERLKWWLNISKSPVKALI